ncbi:synaptonemal complex protein 3-like isoform 2-T4 [Thomomys bottae]
MEPKKRENLDVTATDSKKNYLEENDPQDLKNLQDSQEQKGSQDPQYSQDPQNSQEPQNLQDSQNLLNPQNLLGPQDLQDHKVLQDDSKSTANSQAAANNGKDIIFLGPDEQDVRVKLQIMLQKFQEGINSLVSGENKSNRMKVNASMKTIQDKIENTMKSKYEERQKLFEEYSLEFANLTELLKQDMKKVKEEGRKLASIFEQQIKAFQHSQNLHNKYMEAFEDLYNKYMQSCHEIGDYEENDLSRELNSFRLRMTQIQSKCMKEIEEKCDMLQSLLSLLASQDSEDNEAQRQ